MVITTATSSQHRSMLSLVLARALLQEAQLWLICSHRRTGDSTAGIAGLECRVDGVREGRP